MDGLQKVVSKKVKNVPVNLEEIKSECERTGAKADDLTTCSKTATFAQCMFAKIRTLVIEHKPAASASANVASNTDTTHNANANKEVVPDTKVDTVVAPTATLDTDAVANKDASADKKINLDAIVNENANSDATAKAKDVPAATAVWEFLFWSIGLILSSFISILFIPCETSSSSYSAKTLTTKVSRQFNSFL